MATTSENMRHELAAAKMDLDKEYDKLASAHKKLALGLSENHSELVQSAHIAIESIQFSINSYTTKVQIIRQLLDQNAPPLPTQTLAISEQ